MAQHFQVQHLQHLQGPDDDPDWLLLLKLSWRSGSGDNNEVLLTSYGVPVIGGLYLPNIDLSYNSIL